MRSVYCLLILLTVPLLPASFNRRSQSYLFNRPQHKASNIEMTNPSNILSKFGVRFIAAPMVGQSDLAFRLLVQRHGCDLCFTQMIHARNFIKGPNFKFRELNFDPMMIAEGEEDKNLDRPLIVQFAGDNGDEIVEAAKYVEGQCDAIDLNLGCPQKIAKGGHYGAYLLEEPDNVKRIVETMVSKLTVPVSVKMRILEGKYEETIQFAQMIQEAGASMLTVHGRTIKQNKQLCGNSDRDLIKAIKRELNIPVVANGGIESVYDAMELMQYTGCDAVMSSEALLENPALFEPSQVLKAEARLARLAGHSQEDEDDNDDNDDDSIEDGVQVIAATHMSLAWEYIELAKQFPPSQGNAVVRAHLFKILHRLLSANDDIRSVLARKTKNTEEICLLMYELEKRYSLKRETGSFICTPISPNNRDIPPIGNGSWYRRHR